MMIFLCVQKSELNPLMGIQEDNLIFASALNYSGHHGSDYDKLTFSVRDSNLTGLQVTNVKVKKHITQEESRKQCQTFD
jgi:hypothetical protein